MKNILAVLFFFLCLTSESSAQTVIDWIDNPGTPTGAPSGSIAIGTTAVTGGTNNYILYNNSGVLGNEQTVPVANGGTGASTPDGYYGLPHFRALLATIPTTTQGTVNPLVCVAGDSTIFGQYSDPANVSDVVNSLPTQMANYLISQFGIPADANGFMGDGIATQTFGALDPRITLGSFSQDTSIISIGGGTYKTTTDNGTAMTFTPGTSGDSFVVIYIVKSGGGTISFQIDSETAQTFSTSGTAGLQAQTIQSTVGVNTTHVLNINMTAGTQVNFVGVLKFYDSTKNAVHMANMGWPSATASSWATTGAAYNPGNAASWAALGCNLTLFEDGINDWKNGVSLSTYNTNMQTALTAMTGNGDLAIVTPIPSVTSAATQATQVSFVQAMYALSVTNNLPEPLDIFKRWQSYTVANSSSTNTSLYAASGAGLHPNAQGYGEEAVAIDAALAAVPGQTNNPLGNSPALFSAPRILLTGASYSGPSWTTTSPVCCAPTMTLQDTTGSGTIAAQGAYSFQAPTFTSTTAQTDTVLYTLNVASPIASTNVTATSAYAIYTTSVDAITGYFGAAISTAIYNTSGGRLILTSSAPTIASGFGTSPSFSDSHYTANSFAITIGSSPGTSGVLTMPAAATTWNCEATDQTTPAVAVYQTSGVSTTSVTLSFYSALGIAGSPTAADRIAVICIPH